MELDAEPPKPPAPPIPPPPPPDPPTPSAVQAGAQISYAAAPPGPAGGGQNGIMPPGAPAFYQDPYSSFSQYGTAQQYADPQVRIDNTNWELFCVFQADARPISLSCSHAYAICDHATTFTAVSHGCTFIISRMHGVSLHCESCRHTSVCLVLITRPHERRSRGRDSSWLHRIISRYS